MINMYTKFEVSRGGLIFHGQFVVRRLGLACFPGMTSSLAKLNKSSDAHFLALFLKFRNFLMFLNIQIDMLILKPYYGQFTLTTKKSLHIIFNA